MITVTEEEMAQIRGYQQVFVELAGNLGEVNIQRLMIAKKIVEIETKIEEFDVAQKAFLADLQEKYGKGTVMTDTGEFVPAKQ